jgi:transcriptional regulator with XRE-family HTH domain
MTYCTVRDTAVKWRNEPMIDPGRLGPMLRARRKRHGWSLRRAASEAGVAFNTIARVEAGHLPDVDNYRKLAAWLGVGENTAAVVQEASTMDAITTHLLLDPALDEKDADRIGRMVREMYEALAKPARASAVHLRAATTFKPAAAKMLAELLDDMRSSLESGDAVS